MPPKTERQTGIQTILMLKHLQMLLREKKKKIQGIFNSQILDNGSKDDPQEENVEGF